MPIITISSSFGSSGSVVARAVAERLGWKLLNRAITIDVATTLSVPLELADAHDERAETGWRRLLENLARYSATMPEALGVVHAGSDEVRLKLATERVLRSAADENVVIVGRAAAIVLRDRQDSLHVRLDGPKEARLKNGAAALGLTLAEARVKLEQTDRARAAYVKELFGLDWGEPSLYDLTLDSTAFSVGACADIVLAAAQGRLSLVARAGL